MTQNSSGFFSKINFEEWYNSFLGLQVVQKILVSLGVLAGLLMVIYIPIYFASSILSGLEEDLASQQKSYKDVAKKIIAYQEAEGRFKSLKGKLESADTQSMSAIIDSIAKNAGIGKDNLEGFKPIKPATTDLYEEEGIDTTIKQVTLSQITDFLYQVETYSKIPLKVRLLKILPSKKDKALFSAQIQVTAIKLKGGGNE